MCQMKASHNDFAAALAPPMHTIYIPHPLLICSLLDSSWRDRDFQQHSHNRQLESQLKQLERKLAELKSQHKDGIILQTHMLTCTIYIHAVLFLASHPTPCNFISPCLIQSVTRNCFMLMMTCLM